MTRGDGSGSADGSVYDRGITYEDSFGRVIYRASALGFCPGALVRSRLGVTPSPPPPNIQRAFDAGRANEDALIARGLELAGMTDVQNREHLERYGKVVEQEGSERLQVEVEVACGERALVRCHPDGIAIDKGSLQPYVVEAKLLSQSYYDQIARNGLTPTYRWQAGVECAGTGLPIFYIIGVKDDDGNWDEVDGKVLTYRTDSRLLADLPTELDIKARVWMIEGYVARGEMPDCPLPLMWPCGWWTYHDETEPIESVEDELLESLAAEYARLGVEIAELEDRRKAAAQGILGWWEKAETNDEKISVGKYRVTRVMPDKGNVSWKSVAEKYMPGDVDLDEFRGKPSAASVRVEMEE